MINLNEYDNVNIEHKHWIDTAYKALYVTIDKKRSFFTILSKYNKVDKTTDYYLVLLDEPDNTRICATTYRLNAGIVKCPLKKFWNSLPIYNLNGIIDIVIELKEEDEHTSIYYLDI